MLSQAALSPWAKSWPEGHPEFTHWLPLVQHCDDAEAVGRMLVDHWVPLQTLRRLAGEGESETDSVRALTGWLSANHDVGKASVAFAVKVHRLADRMGDFGLKSSPRAAQSRDRHAVQHALVSHVSLCDWLEGECEFSRRGGSAAQLASILGSHHGITPESTQLAHIRDLPHLMGQKEWVAARTELFHRATERAGGDTFLTRLRNVSLTLPAQVLYCGLVIMADWIASNADYFALQPAATVEYAPTTPDDAETATRATSGWAQVSLPPRWRPTTVSGDLDSAFATRFPHIKQARAFQRAVVDLARAQLGSGLLIVEAPMGWGKTEAAFVAAEVLAHSSGAGGCVVALPTQATTDAMFGRTLDWLRAMPQEDGTQLAVTLAHGKASLNDEYTGLLHSGRFQSIGESEHEDRSRPTVLAVHEWLHGRKKGLLASFSVCTIDQILAAALKSRHVMLRHLGLAGKVVIIDEVHAYDIYMSQYLKRALHWLGAYGVPVLLLSATLPAERRGELLDAYRSGSGEPAVSAGQGYPLVTGSRSGSVSVPLTENGTTVQLDRLPDELPALVGYLRNQLRDGGCVAIVRNTVSRVQKTADALGEAFGEDRVTVAHGRFLSCDRARLDADLVRRFGKPASDNERDGIRIVVASQVIEQSLDVDFDLLVTDLAPMDLVLQRMGRLHRHERDRPAALRIPRCALTGTEDWATHPVRAIRPSTNIYDRHLLLRAAALLHERTEIVLPQDISSLVQQSYSDSELGPESWQTEINTAREESLRRSAKRAEDAKTFLLGPATEPDASLVDWLRASVGDAEGPHGIAQVRDGAETLEVLVVQSDDAGGLLTPDWIAKGPGIQIPLDEKTPHWLAKIVASCTLRLPYAMSHGGVLDAVIGTLEKNKIPGFQLAPLLKGQLVLVLDRQREARVTTATQTFHLIYDPQRGLIHDVG